MCPLGSWAQLSLDTRSAFAKWSPSQAGARLSLEEAGGRNTSTVPSSGNLSVITSIIQPSLASRDVFSRRIWNNAGQGCRAAHARPACVLPQQQGNEMLS